MDVVVGGGDGRGRRGFQEIGERIGPAAVRRCCGGDDFDAIADRGFDRRRVANAVGGKNQSRRDDLESVLQLSEVFRDQRIRRRNGGRWNAHVLSGHRQQKLLEIVFR